MCVNLSLPLSLTFSFCAVCVPGRFIVSHINSGRLVGDVATGSCIRFLQFLACKSLTCFYLMPFWCGAKKLPLAFIAVIKWWKMLEIRQLEKDEESRKATYADGCHQRSSAASRHGYKLQSAQWETQRESNTYISFKCALTPVALSNSNLTHKFMASSKLSIHLLGQIATGA